MSKASTEIIELIKTLTKDVAELKVAINDIREENTMAGKGAEKMYATLSTKLDMFATLSAESRNIIKQTDAASKDRKLTKPAFFKKIFIEHRDDHLNILYSKEDIEAAAADKDVEAKKKDADKITKIASILYTKHIKADNPPGRLSSFTSLYEQSQN